MRRLCSTLLLLIFLTAAAEAIGIAGGGTQFVKNGSSSAVSSLASGNLPASVTSGNCLIVIVRSQPNSESATVADTLGSSFTLRASDVTTHDPHMRLWDTVLTSSGTDAVTVTFTGGTVSFTWIYVIELSSCSAADTGASASGSTEGAATTALVSTAITTSQSVEFVVMGGAQNSFATYTAHADSASNTWTLQDGSIGSGGSNFGGIEYFITSSALSSDTAQMTASASAQYGTVWASYKDNGGGGGAGTGTGNKKRKVCALLDACSD